MKKLYRKGTVHPSPPQIKSDDHLFPLLPVAIFSLAAVLSSEDREVLAYLISTASYSGDRNPTSLLKKTKAHKKAHFDNHSPLFHCDCFSCYTSYWIRWDSSPSRQLIHEIIDAYEDSLERKKNKKKNVTGKKDRRKRSGKSSSFPVSSNFSKDDLENPRRPSESVENSCPCSSSSSSELFVDSSCNVDLEPTEELCSSDGGEEVEEEEKGSVRRFVSFIGEKVFGVWG